uniref:Uncharacterized protein n=1 Tax=Glossina brevipalpis TaxID=37001 RepID=A0A1A9WHP0_9MUSC
MKRFEVQQLFEVLTLSTSEDRLYVLPLPQSILKIQTNRMCGSRNEIYLHKNGFEGANRGKLEYYLTFFCKRIIAVEAVVLVLVLAVVVVVAVCHHNYVKKHL